MRIKKVSITGFKSFMDRLEVNFTGGLSAIVGPNGCGKSNIVDAIRWAMGEQSAKLLRGRNMEDIIFNGADGFKPLGMAEVCITFENGHGSFPAEFATQSELSVTRRLYRSGESEYQLNHVPCRLKDIHEIFMDTGLGNRDYSIIGQGKIGSIIEQRPEETRAMLEEAAGITKYKKKVEETGRKLELTAGNLHRIEDILVEVERQMRSLKRQSAKAKRFKEIGREIQRLELILNANAYHELKQNSSDRIKSTEDLVQEEIALSTTFSRIQAAAERMTLELEEKDKNISGLKEAYFQLKDRVHKKESLLESMAGEKRMQEEIKVRLETEREDLGRRLTSLREERGILLEKKEHIKENAAGQEEEIALLDQRVKGRHALLKEAKEVYEEARTRVNSRMSKEMSLSQESGYLRQRIEEITDGRSRLEKEKEEVRLKIEHIAQVSQRKIEVREALLDKLEAIEQDTLREKTKTAELTQVGKEMEAQLKSVETDLNRHQSRLATLRSMAENFEGCKLGVRTIMKSDDLEPRRAGRILGLVADIMRVDPEFELAVESVLGDKLQCIIVESQKDGKDAVDYLRERSKGRSSFIPLADLNGNGNHANRNGHLLLKDIVSVPETYRNLMDVLLGDAALVDDLGQALSSWAGNGKNQCLVTRDGDIVDPSGIISGGRLAHTSHGILARKREIDDLQERVTSLEGAREELDRRVNENSLEIDQRKALLEGLMEERAECQDKINELDKENFRLSHEMDQLESLSERITEDLEKKGREQSKHREALVRIQSELEECKEFREREESFFQEKEFELKDSEEELEKFREELATLKTAYSLSREEERGLARELERIDDFTYEAERRLDTIGKEISGAEVKSQEYLLREEALREELQVLYERMELASDHVTLAEGDRNQTWSRIREEERKSEDLRGEIEILKEKIHRARMEQSEIKFKMNSLVELVRDKFNLDLSEVYMKHLEEDFSLAETRERLEHQKKLKERLGDVNLTAIQEHEALKERFEFITAQRADLLTSMDALKEAIRKINKTCLERFMTTFEEVNSKLKEVFPILFSGGSACLKLTDETRPLESGVVVEVHPPGKKVSHMALLSGGEKALVAMALLFAIYLIKPSPFCLLDEVDAPLDEANIDRFNELLRKIVEVSQIIMVTHSRRSMEIADRLYGVTMEKRGVSTLVSVNINAYSNN
ncbi:MAG: chromosome segregation protein SMC [Desulfatiglandales bacterium]